MNHSLSGKDFVVFGLQPWDYEMGSNCKNIAAELAKQHRVLYINRPIERSSLYKFRKDAKIQNRLNSLKRGIGVLEQVEKNIWVLNPQVILESINFLPPGFLYQAASQMNARRLGQQIKRAADGLGFSRPILFIDNDFLKGFYLKEFLAPDLFVYYIRDYLRSQSYFVKHGARMEPGIMAKADLVVANSQYLMAYAEAFNAQAFDIGQGCELEGYLNNAYEVPADLQPIKHPIIGYCGALVATRLDISLLQEMATRRKDWNFVLIGPQDEAFQKCSLQAMDNVYFLPPKPATALPAYVHHFDVCINPQLLNQMTIGNYPRKVDEYLAAGKPVVALKTKAMDMFEEYCFLARDTDEFISAIERALAEENQNTTFSDARRNFALTHSWPASVEKLYAAINNHYKKQ